MRRIVVAAVIAAAAGGIGAGSASAVCDPKFRPLCLSTCTIGRPDIKNPTDLSWLIRVCPDSL